MSEQKLETPKESKEERIIRILQKDIPGSAGVYAGLSRIKGVSWTLSKATCIKLKIDEKKKIGDLTESEIKKIEEFLKKPDVPSYLKNRQKDFDTGEDKHLTGYDLDLRKEFDVKRLKKIKSYRGYRHASGLPSRGQKTKSNFRRNRSKGAGIKKKNKK